MPVVFVHGVANRQSEAHQAEVKQRDQLFQRLVLGAADTFIRDPDWGSNAVKLDRGGWIPTKGLAETFSGGASVLPPGGASVAAAAAVKKVSLGVDLAFGALLEQKTGQPGGAQGLNDDELAAFEKAVQYLERQAAPDAKGLDFVAGVTDAKFADTLGAALSVQSAARPLQAPLAGTPERMSIASDVFGAIGKALKDVTDPLRNLGSDALLSRVRGPLSNKVALFLGDIFVYLRGREDVTKEGDFNRIFMPIINALAEAASSQQGTQKLIVVGHSLGGVILYDMLTDQHCLNAIKARTGGEFFVDHLVTVGSQPGLFANMNLFSSPLPPNGGKLPKPACVDNWMNVYDYTDVFSFTTQPFFADVQDFEFDNISGLLDAHTAYFQRPSFYQRLRARLRGGEA